jgi:hypothetical protein
MAILTEPKHVTTSIRMTTDDRELFTELARRLGKRSTGAAVRAVVRETVNILREQDAQRSEPPRFAA